jgi:hypothetical protein
VNNIFFTDSELAMKPEGFLVNPHCIFVAANRTEIHTKVVQGIG